MEYYKDFDMSGFGDIYAERSIITLKYLGKYYVIKPNDEYSFKLVNVKDSNEFLLF